MTGKYKRFGITMFSAMVLLMLMVAPLSGATTWNYHEMKEAEEQHVLGDEKGPIFVTDDDEEEEENDTDDGDEEERDKDGDGVADEEEEEEEREVKIKVEEDTAEIESELEQGERKDKFEMEFEADDIIRLKMMYSKETNTTEKDLEFELEFRRLIEFNDANQNNLYDKSDSIVSNYYLSGKEYEAISYTTQPTADSETEHILSTQTLDGVFKVVLHVTGSFAKIGAHTLRPTEVKIDIIISGYPYEGTDTLLALHSELDTKAKTERDEETADEAEGYAENEEEVEISSDSYKAFFSWEKTATIDGVEESVEAVTKDSSLYLIYQRGNSIVHDPKMGIIRHAPPSGGLLTNKIFLYGLGVLTAVVIIGAAISFRRKKS